MAPWIRFSFSLALIPMLAGCGSDTSDTLSDAEHVLALERGAPAATALAQGLSARLSEAMAEGGPAHAVDFCSIEAIPLTRAIEAELDSGIELKRTSLRWRNPDNAPDRWEEAILRQMDDEDVPEALTGPGPDGTVRYYRPLRTGTQCLACHGVNLDPDAARLIEEAYPDDRATGYGEGDLRGVIRVQITP